MNNKTTTITTDTAALEKMLFELIQNLTRDAEPPAILKKMAGAIKHATNSDRVNLHYVKRTNSGPMLYCWDYDKDPNAPGPFKLTEDKGLISWALAHNDWIMANATKPFEVSQLTKAQTGKAGEITRSAAPTANERRPDNESAMCVFPLFVANQKPKVVLEITRIENFTPYQRESMDKLNEMTPIIASVCMRLIELEQMDAERKAVKQLAKQISETTKIADADNILLKTLMNLSGACGAVMLQYSDSKFGYCIANHWNLKNTTDDIESELSRLFNNFRFHEVDIENPSSVLAASFNLLKKVDCGDDVLIPRQTPLILREHKKLILLIDPMDDNFDAFAPTSSHSVMTSCQQVLEYSHTLLGHYKKSHIRNVIKDLTKQHRNVIIDNAPDEFEKVLKILIDSTLSAIKEACESDAVLIYLGDLQTMEVKGAFPAKDNYKSLNIGEQSLTKRVIKERKSYFIADIYDESAEHRRHLSMENIEKLTNEFSLLQIKSWLTCPIKPYDETSNEQCYGVIKLLTSKAGVMLSKDTKDVVQAIAQRTFWEYHYLLKQHALYDLNLITSRLTGIKGSLLRENVITELEHWAARYVRPNCRVFIYAYTKGKKSLLQCSSITLNTIQKESLITASIAYDNDQKIKTAKGFAACPIKVDGIKDIKGHLFFITEGQLGKDELNFCKDASREINLLAYQEYLHYKQQEYFAVLRHSIMGPVQGLSSRALSAVRRAKKAEGDSLAITQLFNGISEENETIRRWKGVSQIMGEGVKAQIQLKSNNLTKLIKKCISRYQPIAQSREIKIFHDNASDSKQIIFSFDSAAMDIVITNILDNAIKYAFFKTDIHVKCHIANKKVHIRVTDIGHKTPEEDIFEIGARLDWTDPFRIISGEGYGLAICKSLIEAHSGEIRAKSIEENEHSLSEEAKKRYQVTITIILPIRRDTINE